ncbi:hypothetical protein WR25_11437 [Diploscapter pachys]|uniref:Uncharacterized protein n=1 Tax=Diploscapter pachys TaxID=2018661 RepID=A0A2A2K6W4_9BILA|nr:hypothetical protein WR25_11437 [Diploscapter pachys]
MTFNFPLRGALEDVWYGLLPAEQPTTTCSLHYNSICSGTTTSPPYHFSFRPESQPHFSTCTDEDRVRLAAHLPLAHFIASTIG